MSGLRILMYSRYFPPEYSGAALQAISLARQLRKMGHYIEFVTQCWPGLEVHDRVDGFPVTRLEAGRGRKHRELRLWWNLFQFLRRRRGDFSIIHSHGAYYTDSVIGPLGRRLGIRSLVKASLANNDLHDLGRSLAGRIHLYMLSRVDACIAVSRDLETEFLEGGVPRERVYYLPNSVDTARFRPATTEEKAALRQKLGLANGRPVALYVGVFDSRKNVDWLMRQWERTNGFDGNVQLLAIGPKSRDDPHGTFKGALASLAERQPELMRVADEIDNVEDYYRAADIFVMPSKSEGLPNAVLEAMACGLPSIAADVSGTRELVSDGKTGYLFKLNDGEGLSSAIDRALGDGASMTGVAAREFVERNFSVTKIAGRYEALCERLVRDREPL